MKKFIYIIIIFYIYMFIASIFALQIERYDEHIKSIDTRNNYILLRISMILTSGLTVLFYFFKKYKLSIFFGIFFIFIIVINSGGYH